MLVPRHYEDLNVLHENTLPNRAYYIPASRPMEELVENRSRSDRFQLLSGVWRFQYYGSIYDAREPFFQRGFDASSFDTIQVPGMWQTQGYDVHQYTNVKYPFPFDPPYVPQENPCGAYIREFDYHADPAAPRAYLNFEGVDSCFYVWVNGSYIGYSQISHSTSEFDITDQLTEGTNTLAVLVLKWCDGSYLEDQDKFRMSGIFRDVYLLKRPENHLRDYKVETSLDSLTLRLHTTAPVTASLYDGDRLLARDQGSRELHFSGLDVKPWTAETPSLYTLVLETEGETILDRVGFRQVSIRDKVVLLNGSPLHFRGVNRHDSDPVTGFAISLEQMKKDLLLMKQHNINAIRTSHYPNSPVFYQLCDQYGFYVIDEADNEIHGACELIQKEGQWVDTWCTPIANNPQWTPSVLDRIQHLVQRDQNRPCVLIWSMGNEGAYGCTFEQALRWTKAYDPTRLTHYESSIYAMKDRAYDYSNLDLYSRMYPSFREMEEYLRNGDKPFVLCEYSHAMGNGPGDLEEYYQLFRREPMLCGGFVWEWCDHAIYKGQAENGKPIYFYGGDHQEATHDGNFCMDGLVYPDRRPHTGLLELKNVQRPARVVAVDQSRGAVTLENQLDFLDLKDALTLCWQVTRDGEPVASGTLDAPETLPHQQSTLILPFPVPEAGRVFLKLSYLRKHSSDLLPQGFDLGFDEVELENAAPRCRCIPEAGASEHASLTLLEEDRYLTVEGADFRYVYNKLTGLWQELAVKGSSLLEKPMEINLWRAPTDNDRNEKQAWYRAWYHRTSLRAYRTGWEQTGNGITIRSQVAVVAITIQRILEGEVIWQVLPGGEITMDLQMKRDPVFPQLPRFGLRLFLPEAMDQVAYFGMGPQESYWDKHRASWHGLFSSRVEEQHEDYLRPQENGSHYDCDFVTVSGGNRKLMAVGGDRLCFNASPYTQEELTQKQHSFELETSGYTVLCLDMTQTGIGSNSCGPALDPQYRLEQEQLRFHLRLLPEVTEGKG